jgi:hypothetical protein
MNQLIHADVFFFVTTIAIVVLSIAVLIALIYLIIILRNLKDFSKRAKEEGMAVLDDVTSVRHFVKEKSHTLASLFGIFSLVHRKRRKGKQQGEREE